MPNPKGGAENLTSFATMDREKQKAIASAGGKASVEARRKKKEMRAQIETLLSMPVKSKKARNKMAALGLDADDMDNQMAVIVALFNAALGGEVKAFLALRDTLGEMPVINQNVNVIENQKFSDIVGQLGGQGLGDDD